MEPAEAASLKFALVSYERADLPAHCGSGQRLLDNMSGAADQTLEDELHGCIAKLLRKDYPFTQTSLINVAATAATREAINRIKEL